MNGVSIIFFAGNNFDSNNKMIVRAVINPTKKRKVEGKDVFSLVYVNGENGYYLGTYDLVSDKSTLVKYCDNESSRVGGGWTRAGFCTELIKRSGWIIPPNYPIKF